MGSRYLAEQKEVIMQKKDSRLEGIFAQNVPQANLEGMFSSSSLHSTAATTQKLLATKK